MFVILWLFHQQAIELYRKSIELSKIQRTKIQKEIPIDQVVIDTKTFDWNLFLFAISQ